MYSTEDNEEKYCLFPSLPSLVNNEVIVTERSIFYVGLFFRLHLVYHD